MKFSQVVDKNKEQTAVQLQIDACKNLEEIFQLGRKYRDQAELKKDNERIDGLKLAFKCFSHIVQHIGKNIKPENINVFGRSVHNVAMIEEKFGHYQEAAQGFYIASKSGLEASTRNLERMKKMGHLAEKKEKILSEVPVLPDLSQYIVPVFEKRMNQFIGDDFIERIVSSMTIDEKDKKKFIADSKNKHYLKQEIKKIREQATEKVKLKFQEKDREIAQANNLLKKNTKASVDEFFRLKDNICDKNVFEADLEQAKFKENHLKEFERVAHEIKKLLKADDLLVVLGRSPLYFTRMLGALFPEIQMLEIPFSSGYKVNQVTTEGLAVDEDSISSYKEFMKSKGLNASFFSDTQPCKRIVLIDRTEHGRSMITFSGFLKEIDSRFETSEMVKFLGLITEENQGRFTFDTIVIDNKAIEESIKKHFDEQSYSFGLPFHPEEWNEWREKDFNLPLHPYAQTRLDQILEWAKQHR